MKFEFKPIGNFFRLQKGLGYLGKHLSDSTTGLVGLNSFLPGGGYKYGGEKPYSVPYKPEHEALPGDLFIATTDITQDGRVLASPFLLPDKVANFEKMIFSGDIVKAVQINEGLLPEFLFNILRVQKFRSQAAYASTGTTVRRIPSDFVESISIPVPPVALQRVINSCLRSVDQKIHMNVQLSKTLEDIAHTIFRSWFIDFDPVKDKMAGETPVGMDAETDALFPDSMEDSELGLIPEGWTVKSLFDFGLEIESGSRPKGGVKGILSGVPSIGAESINGLGVFEFSKTKFISEEFYEKMNKGKPKDFDVLLYKDGGKPGEFKPRVGMYGLGFPFKRFALNEHVFLLRANLLGQPFTYFWIRLERTLDILRNRGIKAAIPGINQQDVGTIPTIFPGKEVLDKFDEIAFPYIKLILTLASESLELAKLRDALLPRLISGELQIPDEMPVS